MTPIPPIPEERLASQLWREWNEYKAAAHATGIGGMDHSKWLIERIAKLTAANEELERENTRLKAPVSDEEWYDCGSLVSKDEGRHYDRMIDRACFDSIIAARATRTPPQEGQ